MKIKILVVIFLLSHFLYAGQAEYRKTASHGLDVYYREFGEGAPILVLGGGPGDVSDRYVSLCEGLAKDHRCILVDQRGTGKSTPAVLDSETVSIALTLEDFEALRKSLGLKEWAVLGFSYGGYLASLYAHFYPDSVSQLLLLGSLGLNTDAFPHFIDNITSRLRPSDLELFEYWNDPTRAAADPKHALVERIRTRMPGYFFDRNKALSVSQVMKDNDFNFDMGAFIWQDVEKRNLDLPKMAPRFAKPVLILHGRQDPLGESVPQKLSLYYKNSRLEFIEKCGHYSWIEQPEKVFSAVKDFLADQEDRETEKEKIARVISSVIGWAKEKDLGLFYGSIANDEDYVSVTPGKRVIKRFEDVKQNVPFWMSPDFQYVRHELKDLEITFARCGEVAWFFCVLDDINTYKGEPAAWENTRWTGVVEKRDGKWVVVAQHFSFAQE